MTATNPVHQLLNAQCDAFLAAADHFRTLVPSPHHSGAAHSGEEGRYVESLLTEWLRQSLPERVEVATGFVVDVAAGLTSYQVDVLAYDRLSHAPYLRFGDAVVVQRQSLVAAISTKKRLRASDVPKEAARLGDIGAMCGGQGDARPYLSVFALESDLTRNAQDAAATAFDRLAGAYPERPQQYSANELLDSVIVLGEFLLRKERWRGDATTSRAAAPYLWTGGDGPHRNVYLQELLHGIETCLDGSRALPGPTPSRRQFPSIGMGTVGSIPVCAEDRPYQPASPTGG